MKEKTTPGQTLEDLVKGIRLRVKLDRRSFKELAELCGFSKSYSYFVKIVQGDRTMTMKSLEKISSLYVKEIKLKWKD